MRSNINVHSQEDFPNNVKSCASIFTAEVTAINLALDAIAESDDDYLILFSDSLSVLLSLHNKKWITH